MGKTLKLKHPEPGVKYSRQNKHKTIITNILQNITKDKTTT